MSRHRCTQMRRSNAMPGSRRRGWCFPGHGPEGDDGMTTAEYAVGTLAACGFAGVLLKVVTSAAVHDALAGLLSRALASAG